ncbi:MAG: hypothetical protein ABJB74_00795 [Gemmatimonas sp.]
MSSAAELAQLLVDASQTRAVIDTLKHQLDELRNIEEARIAYDARLANESSDIKRLKAERDRLMAERTRKKMDALRTQISTPPVPFQRDPIAASATSAPATNAAPRQQTGDRRKLKKLISRWQVTWSLNQLLIAQVNSIADDANRPIGEALALFDATVFQTAFPGESPDDHTTRVREWNAALNLYVEHLRSDIRTVQTRFRAVLAIWERWRAAKANDTGTREWELFIARSQQQKRAEIEALVKDIATLQAAAIT